MQRSALGCLGRTELVATLAASAMRERCVMLYGGMSAGKTSVLRCVEQQSLNEIREAALTVKEVAAAVYVDMGLMPRAETADEGVFYGYLLERAAAFANANVNASTSHGDGVEAFVDGLDALLAQRKSVTSIVFLLDEAARMFGRLPRGLQDNLFSILYGGLHEKGRNLAFVFAGGRELEVFCERETSPLLARAKRTALRNVNRDASAEMVRELMPAAGEDLLAGIFKEAGGHCGVTAHFIQACVAAGCTVDANCVEQVRETVTERCRQLFEYWLNHLSEESKVVLGELDRVEMSEDDVNQALEKAGRERLHGGRVWDEIQYVGIGRLDGDGRLTRCNELFWRYYQDLGLDTGGTSDVENAVRAALKRNEDGTLEFKSTARKNLRTGKKDAAVEWAVFKTVAAFANAAGGSLVVGVDDQAKVVGVDHDFEFLQTRAQNADGWESWLTGAIGARLGQEAKVLIEIGWCEIDHRSVAWVEVKPSRRPIYARDEKEKVHFFVRTGNSTTEMQVDSATTYVKDHFPDG